jgi:hypothetical protein
MIIISPLKEVAETLPKRNALKTLSEPTVAQNGMPEITNLPSVDYHCPTKQLVTNVFVFAQRSQRKGGHADAMGQVERTYSAASQATCSVLLAPAEHFTEQVVRTGHNRHGRPRRATQHPPCSSTAQRIRSKQNHSRE